MKRASQPRSTLQFLVRATILGLAALLAPLAFGADRFAPPVVTAMPVGHPIWRPVDFQMFAAPIGTSESGYVEFNVTMQRLMPPPDHSWDPALGVAPGAAHVGNYGHEISDGVRALGLRNTAVFPLSDFTRGQGVWLAWMNVPDPGTVGASPDFSRGRVIPNALFPIHVVANDYHGGRRFSLTADFTVPALDAGLGKRYAGLDGHSHFPIFIADNGDFGPPGTSLPGSYRYVVTMLDTSGQGWLVIAEFTVEGVGPVASTSGTANPGVKINTLFGN